MPISLKKGQKVDLMKEGNGSTHYLVGLGWDANMYSGADFDLDASVFCVDANGKVTNDLDFVFYNNLQHPSGGVIHMGDNLTGGNNGDSEQIEIDLNKIPSNIDRVIFAVTIYEADTRNQNFGMIRNAYIRLFDTENNQEVIRFDLTEEYSIETAMEIGALYRKNGGWKFDAIGAGYSGGLAALCRAHGVQV